MQRRDFLRQLGAALSLAVVQPVMPPLAPEPIEINFLGKAMIENPDVLRLFFHNTSSPLPMLKLFSDLNLTSEGGDNFELVETLHGYPGIRKKRESPPPFVGYH